MTKLMGIVNPNPRLVLRRGLFLDPEAYCRSRGPAGEAPKAARLEE
jgi:hypothetical protein